VRLFSKFGSAGMMWRGWAQLWGGS